MSELLEEDITLFASWSADVLMAPILKLLGLDKTLGNTLRRIAVSEPNELCARDFICDLDTD